VTYTTPRIEKLADYSNATRGGSWGNTRDVWWGRWWNFWY